MSATTIIIIFYLILAVVGIVCLYNGYDMKVNGNLKIGWFVGQEIKKEKCKDIPGFIAATIKPIMIFGCSVTVLSIAMVILGGLVGTEDVIIKFIQLTAMLIISGLFFWLNRKINKATDKYIK